MSKIENKELSKLFNVMQNKHFAMAADEYKEYVSDYILSKHDSEYRIAEGNFINALNSALLDRELNALGYSEEQIQKGISKVKDMIQQEIKKQNESH